MNNNSTAIDSVTAWCSYTWIDGNTYFANDSTTTFTLTNAAGCDSVITLNLTILNVSSGITNFNSTLTSSVSQFTGATYQWVDCNNNYATISGETNPTFTPTSNGSYAVVVYLNSCADTSSCENVIISSIVEKSTEIAPKIFPNPTSGKLTIEFENLIEQFQIKIYDATGRLLSSAGFQNQRVIQLPMDYPAGPYFLNILTHKDRLVIPVIKK